MTEQDPASSDLTDADGNDTSPRSRIFTDGIDIYLEFTLDFEQGEDLFANGRRLADRWAGLQDMVRTSEARDADVWASWMGWALDIEGWEAEWAEACLQVKPPLPTVAAEVLAEMRRQGAHAPLGEPRLGRHVESARWPFTTGGTS